MDNLFWVQKLDILKRLKTYGSKHALGVSSGTDALLIINGFMAKMMR